MWLQTSPSTALFALILPTLSLASSDCSKTQYDRCVRIADPLVKEPHLVFPDNLDDIDRVCRTWNQFVDCLKMYTDDCFTDQQRKQFNRAVENPIESVHEMCMQPSYQKEYLQYAPCIKNTITQRIHCGPHYNLLVDQVSQGDIISKSTLCCSHDRFKQCVQRETRRLCDRGIADEPATRFATQIIDKALSFLQDQCLNYIPNSGDCTTLTTDTLPYSDPLMISTSSSEVYPWSTIQDNLAPKEILPSRVTPPKIDATSSSWLPHENSPQPMDSSSPNQMLGGRTRPASYGRSNSWSDSPNSVTAGNTVQMYPENPSTPPSRPDWATVNSWNVMGGQSPGLGNPKDSDNSYNSYGTTSRNPAFMSSTETWYPAAGNQLNNEVDEPNQLGLRKPKNSAEKLTKTQGVLSITVLATILTALC